MTDIINKKGKSLFKDEKEAKSIIDCRLFLIYG